MNVGLDAISYNNQFRSIPASYKIIFTFLLGTIAYLSNVEVQLILFVVVFSFLLIAAKIPFTTLCKWIAVPSLFLVVSMPALVVNMSQAGKLDSDLLFSVMTIRDWQIYISKAGLQLAFISICRALSLFICVLALLLTTPFNEILQALHKFGLPQTILDLLASMYRFIFIFFQHAKELSLVVQSRQGNVTWKQSLHSASLVVFQLFFKTFEKYKRMTLVLESRGFSNQIFYPIEKVKKLPFGYVALGCLFIIFLIGFEWWCRNS